MFKEKKFIKATKTMYLTNNGRCFIYKFKKKIMLIRSFKTQKWAFEESYARTYEEMRGGAGRF